MGLGHLRLLRAHHDVRVRPVHRVRLLHRPVRGRSVQATPRSHHRGWLRRARVQRSELSADGKPRVGTRHRWNRCCNSRPDRRSTDRSGRSSSSLVGNQHSRCDRGDPRDVLRRRNPRLLHPRSRSHHGRHGVLRNGERQLQRHAPADFNSRKRGANLRVWLGARLLRRNRRARRRASRLYPRRCPLVRCYRRSRDEHPLHRASSGGVVGDFRYSRPRVCPGKQGRRP